MSNTFRHPTIEEQEEMDRIRFPFMFYLTDEQRGALVKFCVRRLQRHEGKRGRRGRPSNRNQDLAEKIATRIVSRRLNPAEYMDEHYKCTG